MLGEKRIANEDDRCQGVEKGRILVVDDQEAIRRLLYVALREQGFWVKTVATGEEALEAIEVVRPDLVFLDLKMPGMGGNGVLGRLRECNYDGRVVVMTAYPEVCGATPPGKPALPRYLVKPFDLHDLFEVVGRFGVSPQVA